MWALELPLRAHRSGRAHAPDPPPRTHPTARAESLTKTKQAVALLKTLGADADLARVAASRNLRRGKGKMRNRRYVQRKGPLVIYGNDSGIR